MSPEGMLDRSASKKRRSPRIFNPARRGKRLPMPEDWGLGMTVCIAGLSCERRDQQRLVLVGDLLLATEEISIESPTLKIGTLVQSGHWGFAYSGLPSVATKIVSSVHATLKADGSETAERIGEVFAGAYREELKYKIEGELLSRYGWSCQEFLDKGRKALGNFAFRELLGKMNEAALETDFLAVGFEPDGRPRILLISDPGVYEHCEPVGFHAIGTGSTVADGYLCGIYNVNLNPVDLIYRLCEAKFWGESAFGVGRRTFVLTISPDGKQTAIVPKAVEELHSVWEAQGKPPVPEAAKQVIQRVLQPWSWKWSG